ncbi:MAG: hypothetical protein RL582_512 [Bacteroidota bacterium]
MFVVCGLRLNVTTNNKHQTTNLIRPRSTMDSIRVSEAPDPSSILGEATNVFLENNNCLIKQPIKSTYFHFLYFTLHL